ncbi:MAG: penicillin-binding protein 2 [Pseudomonadota bacterium]
MARVINRVQQGNEAVFRSRFYASAVIFLILSLLIWSRYAFLQIIDYEKYHMQSENNRVHLRPITPGRGHIYARNGEVLAKNFPSFVLTVSRGLMKDMKDEMTLVKELLELSDQDMLDIKESMAHYRAYDDVPIKYNLTEAERAILAANKHRLPGMSVSTRFVRKYPHSELFAHVIGYVGRISEKDQKDLNMDEYAGIYHTGKLGLEKFYEDVLKGRPGHEQVETNVRGKVLRSLNKKSAELGDDLQLFLDFETQKKATEMLKGEVGAVVALDVKTGGVVSFVSMPNYDPNLFVNGISVDDYARLRDSVDIPMYNRVLRGLYPPASTIKPFMALAGLSYNKTDLKRTVRDPGWFRLKGSKRKYRDWKRAGHGNAVNLDLAIAQSCDIYFYDLATRLGVDRIEPVMSAFGFGQKTNIDLVGEKSGLMPSRAWKKKRHNEDWYPGDTVNIGIGQGYMQASPLQLVSATAMIIRNGVHIEPRLVKSVNNKPTMTSKSKKLNIKQEQWDAVKKAMDNVVNSNYGTAMGARHRIKARMAGKTGTAQVVGIAQNAKYDSKSLKKKQRDHALFIGYAPVDNPRVAVAVVVENGESGGGRAAPIAAKVMDTYLNSLEATPAPKKIKRTNTVVSTDTVTNKSVVVKTEKAAKTDTIVEEKVKTAKDALGLKKQKALE